MKRTPKAPRAYPPIDCPPCKHGCDQVFDQRDPNQCVHDEPLVSDAVIARAMLTICIALAVLALAGWL